MKTMKRVAMFVIGAIMAFGCFAIGWYWGFYEGNASFEKASIGELKTAYQTVIEQCVERGDITEGAAEVLHLDFRLKKETTRFINEMDRQAAEIGEIRNRWETVTWAYTYWADVSYEIVIGDPVYIDGECRVPVETYYAVFGYDLRNTFGNGDIVREWKKT